MAGNGGIIGPCNVTSAGKNTVTSKTSTGAVTTQSGTRLVDYLVVAGGGGGGHCSPTVREGGDGDTPDVTPDQGNDGGSNTSGDFSAGGGGAGAGEGGKSGAGSTTSGGSSTGASGASVTSSTPSKGEAISSVSNCAVGSDAASIASSSVLTS